MAHRTVRFPAVPQAVGPLRFGEAQEDRISGIRIWKACAVRNIRSDYHRHWILFEHASRNRCCEDASLKHEHCADTMAKCFVFG